MADLSPIAAAIWRQLDRALFTLADALDKIDDAGYRSGDVDFLIPARMAYHAAATVDFYFRPAPQRQATNALGGNWEFSPPAELPARKRIRDYIGEVRSRVQAYLGTLDDAQLLSAETQFPWTGETILDRCIYAIRHTQHHTAQINAELRRRGLPRGEWR